MYWMHNEDDCPAESENVRTANMHGVLHSKDFTTKPACSKYRKPIPEIIGKVETARLVAIKSKIEPIRKVAERQVLPGIRWF